MVFISEWLPNPVGPDAAGEFIELYNAGAAAVRLDGWTIKTEKGRSLSLAGRIIPSRGYLTLKKRDAKFTLRNVDGALALYAPGGATADAAGFAGAAPEGRSFSRADFAAGPAAHFAWSVPTPGAANKTPLIAVAAPASYPYGAALNPQFTFADFFAIMMGTAALVAGLILYIIKHHEDLSKLFAARDRTIRGAACEAGALEAGGDGGAREARRW